MTTNINFRVDSEVKEQAEAIFKKAGLNTSAALNLFLKQAIISKGIPFLKQAIISKGIPFPIYAEIPNKKTLKAFTEVENGINVKTYNTPEELWQEIEQELEPEDNAAN